MVKTKNKYNALVDGYFTKLADTHPNEIVKLFKEHEKSTLAALTKEKEALLKEKREAEEQVRQLSVTWSDVTFESPSSGKKICAPAPHAAFGKTTGVSGSLVNAEPITAHEELTNADKIRDCVAYIKRGKTSFINKARVAVAANACACVVANHDKETFSMMYTSDGLPAIDIPCVMISADIAKELESCSDWKVTLVLILESQYTVTLQSEYTRALTF
jgi:hypothetical protein